jgi:superfamily II DNA or RNA helicase
MSFAVGSLVKARGREWVVLPESEQDLLILRPLGGTEDEVTGIYLPLEMVRPAQFDLPDPRQCGDHHSCRLLRDAVRLGFRSSAGPFRSFAGIAVEPRPYQLVPLLMALKLDPVRLLIADDVGIGKTIEACLIAKELLDRGEVTRLAVLCLPQLAEQWQRELKEKFHIDAELVLSSTASRLERNCRLGQSLFDVYPFVVVSTDFIKSDRRRDEFLRSCPELVVVDEAHTCAWGGVGRGGRHQRHQLVTGLAEKSSRHMILVTATPHSGNEAAFRSLLGLVDPAFSQLPEDMTGAANEALRRRLAAHLVQRRRADISHYLQTDTPFPGREEAEETYKLSEPYRRLFDRVLKYARESVMDESGGRHRQRVRWWSALALLQSLASSPVAAAETMRTRAKNADEADSAEAEERARQTLFDQMAEESAEGVDVTQGADPDEPDDEASRSKRRLQEMAREADQLAGAQDAKLQKAITLVKSLVAGGHRPIVFCRFIATAEYVAKALAEKLPKAVEVAAVTGTLPPAEREERVAQLAAAEKHVLVCTDCLSEGINLQEYFDAVVHYDLSWNPTRHEQREGRVDRYGQPKKTVRILTYYGLDNQIDGIVLDVLLRKHKKIRSSLGISVPVPVNSDQVIEAIFEGLLLRGESARSDTGQLNLAFDDLFREERDTLHTEWDAAGEREKRSRTMFAQETIKADEVAGELTAVNHAIGSGVEVARFTRDALRAVGATVSGTDTVEIDLSGVRQAVKDAIGESGRFRARFALPVSDGVQYLSRTHPVVEGIATYAMDTALDPHGEGPARRCGAIRTDAVKTRTTVLLVRYRFHIVTRQAGTERALLAEDLVLLAFEGVPENAVWLPVGTAEALLDATPAGNIHADQAATFIHRVVDGAGALGPHLGRVAAERGEELLAAHKRVRSASRLQGVQQRIEPQLPPDVLGIYVYLPIN